MARDEFERNKGVNDLVSLYTGALLLGGIGLVGDQMRLNGSCEIV